MCLIKDMGYVESAIDHSARMSAKDAWSRVVGLLEKLDLESLVSFCCDFGIRTGYMALDHCADWRAALGTCCNIIRFCR